MIYPLYAWLEFVGTLANIYLFCWPTPTKMKEHSCLSTSIDSGKFLARCKFGFPVCFAITNLSPPATGLSIACTATTSVFSRQSIASAAFSAQYEGLNTCSWLVASASDWDSLELQLCRSCCAAVMLLTGALATFSFPSDIVYRSRADFNSTAIMNNMQIP